MVIGNSTDHVSSPSHGDAPTRRDNAAMASCRRGQRQRRPPGIGDDAGTCGPASARLGEYGCERILDITHAYRPELPVFGPDGLGLVVQLKESMANGSLFNLSELRTVVHAGTHVDAPGHMMQEHLEAGFDVDTDGAQWLVNTDIKLIGVHYLSVAAFYHLISAYVVFFKSPDIIPVEGLKLDDVKPGIYMLHCLPQETG